MNNINPKINLLNFTRSELACFFTKIGEPSFRAQQVIQWIHQCGVTDFSLMTNLSLSLREYLTNNATVFAPTIACEQKSIDGTIKWLFKLFDGNFIETVFIPESGRGTLCVSSQVGCALKCDFCATGKLGFKRNLTLDEIIGQLFVAISKLANEQFAKSHVITNVVFMGMGEPLLNRENVTKAVDLMLDDIAYGLSKYKVTISTVGIIPEMLKLSQESKASLAISLHAPENVLRSSLIPTNKQYPLKELIEACKSYYKNEPRRIVTIEYIMLDGINDSKAQARQLVNLLHDLPCKINLIPFNFGVATENCKYRPSPQTTIDIFRQILMDAGINTITRKSRGMDIFAACGQLAGTLQGGSD